MTDEREQGQRKEGNIDTLSAQQHLNTTHELAETR